MQEYKSQEELGSWSQLASTKEYMLFNYVFGNYSNIKPLLVLTDKFVSAGEMRLQGLTRVNVELVFRNIVECKDEGLYRYWRLTPLGMKLRQKLIEIISLLKEAI